MTGIKIILTDNQLKKLQTLFKKQTSVKLRLSYEQITKKAKFNTLLTKAQKEKLDASKKFKTGFILEFDHEQIKTGGSLPALIAAIRTILSCLEGIGGVGSAAAAITNAIKTAKHQSAEEEEAKRHNLEMEKLTKEKQTGSGLKK